MNVSRWLVFRVNVGLLLLLELLSVTLADGLRDLPELQLLLLFPLLLGDFLRKVRDVLVLLDLIKLRQFIHSDSDQTHRFARPERVKQPDTDLVDV